ncbi:MAG: carotenoid oxygenase family protein, partial [Deltaproteobacteria bacterium]|nr:carotenoid oxygenase family protein [Deltaproteobacteria bacterium]
CFVFHTFNAYDGPNGTVILEAVRYDELWVEGPYSFDRPGKVVRFTFDPAAGTGKYDVLDDRPLEFPQIDRRLQGKKHRYGYGVWLGEPDLEYRRLAGTRGLLKHDLQNGGTQSLELAPAESADEAFFVPASDKSGEDEGYLLSYVYDRRTERTSLYILDAQDIEAGPVAKVKLPVRVPFGFHGDWVPAGS